MHKQEKKIDKLKITAIKNSCASKSTIKEVKRQPIERKKINCKSYTQNVLKKKTYNSTKSQITQF